MHIISSSSAPQAVGPYSQATLSGDFVFLSGQIALDPETMTLVGETASEQTEQICQNITAVLGASGLDRSHVVKTTIFLTNIDDFASVNEVYGKYFSHRPARSTVAVLALPKGAKVEIECIAEKS